VSPNDNFRRELNNVFDDVSGAPSPALKDRVRSAVAEAPETRSIYWVAAVAAVLITALIVGVLFVANPLRRQTGLVGPGPTPTPSASPSPSSEPTPSPSPTPLPQFICSADTLTNPNPAHLPTAYISAVRPGSHASDGYDRIVVDFSNGRPDAGVELKPQTGTKFVTDPKGDTVTLKGTNGLEIVIKGADMHTSYSGAKDWVTGFATVAEVRQVGDFEGVVNLAVGINGPPCYRAFYLTGPDRLVVDVQAAS
jgi:hypothetical protein